MPTLPMTFNMTAETEPANIARGLRERDMELLANLVEIFQHRLVRYLPYLTGSREYAENLAQDTWFRVLKRGRRYNGRQRFNPSLFAIARNLSKDCLRKKRKGVETASLPDDPDGLLLLLSSGPSPFEAAAQSEDAMRLAGQLQILSPLYRKALLLRFQEDLSLLEIAQVLRAPVTTVHQDSVQIKVWAALAVALSMSIAGWSLFYQVASLLTVPMGFQPKQRQEGVLVFWLLASFLHGPAAARGAC